ncbi:MAG: diguanylate cyclase [Frankiales bacterium]|nr:diguanylate cyclase [Frankiales bacterium]
MYDAKRSGRSRSSLFLAPMTQQAQDRLDLATDLREALAQDGLEMRYQPVVDLRSGALVGVEALARWDHLVRGAVPPAVFVAVAEATGSSRRSTGGSCSGPARTAPPWWPTGSCPTPRTSP